MWTLLAAEGIGKNIQKMKQGATKSNCRGGCVGSRSPGSRKTRGQDYVSGKTLTFHLFDTNFNYAHSDIL